MKNELKYRFCQSAEFFLFSVVFLTSTTKKRGRNTKIRSFRASASNKEGRRIDFWFGLTKDNK